MNQYLTPPGFLGTGASLLADLTLVAYVLLIMPGMILGYVFARRGKHRPHHKYLMITITVVNWLLIIFLMLAALTFDVLSNLPSQPANTRYLFPAVHGLLGLTAQGLATYVVYRMIKEDVQVARAKKRGEKHLSKYWFKSAKPVMRLTLALWLITATIGIVTYLVRYNVIPAPQLGTTAPAPVFTPEVIAPETTAEATDPPAATQEIEVTQPPETETVEVAPIDATPEPLEEAIEATAQAQGEPPASTEEPIVIAAAPTETAELPPPPPQVTDVQVAETEETSPTATPRPPTITPVPPTATQPPASPTVTRRPPTITPVPPTATRQPASLTATRRPPTITPRAGATRTVAVPTLAPGTPLVQIGVTQDHGTILVNPQGQTLYVYRFDEPNWSNCVGACLGDFSPYIVPQDAELIAGPLLTGQLALSQRADRTYQVTYNTQPLYTCSRDRQAGDARCEDEDWSVVRVTPGS